MAEKFAKYSGATGFLLVILGTSVPHAIPGTATFFGHLLYWSSPLGFADMTSAPWWSVMLGAALENGLLYAALGLGVGLAATAARRLASGHRGRTAKD
jgi:uncharacterized membrane protein